MTDPIPELLAPAGQAAAALAAFDAGADAIYAGLPKFNARERGENFTADAMAATIEYAHRLNRKVYLTLNTLIKEPELPEMAAQLGEVAAMAPDAVIVQDLGVLKLIRDYFPTLTVHASTQMGFHNSAGLKIAERLGVKRVILERQVTLDELREMKRKSPLELEVFVHGALCCSLSGSCLFSSWLGGASGNRGQCKQPCRRRFFGKEGNGFFFSTADLAALEVIPQLKEIGVASLKIEGRLRQPDYVYAAVQAYRKVLDAPEVNREVLGEARKLLSSTCGRRWSIGFYTPESAATLVQHNALGTAGMLIGKVEAIRENGFSFTPRKRFHVGDRLRIQPPSGDEGPAFTVTKLFSDNRPSLKGTPGVPCSICCDKEIPADGLIFKIGESGKEFNPARLEAIPLRKKLDLSLMLDGRMLTVTVLNAPGFAPWSVPLELAPADRRPATAEQLQAAFQAGENDRFGTGSVQADVQGNWFLPASVLKTLKKQFKTALENTLDPAAITAPGDLGMLDFCTDYQNFRKSEWSDAELRETVMLRPHGATAGNPKALKAVDVFQFNRGTDEVILPDFCAEGRLGSLQKAIARAYESGIRRFRITSLYGFALLQDYPDAVRVTAFPLPAANSQAAAVLKELGAARIQASIELERAGIEALRDHSPLPLEIYRYGRPALLSTRAALPGSGDVRDNRGNAFRIQPGPAGGITRLYAKTVFSIPRLPGTADCYDLTEAWWGEKETGTFNFNGGWL